MKKILLLVLVAAAALAGSTKVSAQGKFGPDSAECIKYLSYYTEYYKQKNYDAAYDALVADEEAMRAYSMTMSLTLVIMSLGILAAVLLWEFVIPLWFGNGQSLGKKIFSLCLVRPDGVKINNMQLFTRAILGKYTVETMAPIFIGIMIFWGIVGLSGTLCLIVLVIAQLLCLSRGQSVHDDVQLACEMIVILLLQDLIDGAFRGIVPL